jgi:hypothetical protein
MVHSMAARNHKNKRYTKRNESCDATCRNMMLAIATQTLGVSSIACIVELLMN